jgi:TonB family protein
MTSSTRKNPWIPALTLALLLAALPAAAADTVITRTALLIGFPGEEDATARALVVPGTVIPLSSEGHASAAAVRAEGERGHRLAEVARGLERSLRLEKVEVSYTLAPELAVGEPKALPPPSLDSGLRIEVELLGASPEAATYRVAFADGASPITDSRVAVRRGERAVVGGLDGASAPYLFLVLEPAVAGAAPPAGPRFVGGDVKPPVRIEGPPPSYTPEAREERIQGVVIVQAVIDESGRVTAVKPLKGLPQGLTEAATDAIRQWRFEPARDAAGEPVSVFYNLTINFRLDDEPEDAPGAEQPPG